MALPTTLHVFESTELLGYMAAGLVLMTFSVRSMALLRSLALLSNVAFVAYAWLAGLAPVLALHMILLPLNAWRLWQEVG
ncbi:MAG: hypothetical protein U1E89_03015 [Burkholderiaceae bacterium]